MKKGFSLLEIMIALAILSSSLLILFHSHSNSVLTSSRSEKVRIASLLAREYFVEFLIQVEQDMALGSFPDEKEDTGAFEEPYSQYKWELKIRKIKIPMMGGGGGDGAKGNARVTEMVTKRIEESVRELKLRVFWNEGEEEEEVSFTTHIVNIL